MRTLAFLLFVIYQIIPSTYATDPQPNGEVLKNQNAYDWQIQAFPEVPTRNEWRLVEIKRLKLKYWQALPSDARNSVFNISSPTQRVEEIFKRISKFDEVQNNGAGCAPGMVRVIGKMKNWAETVFRQNNACLDPTNFNPTYLCNSFDSDKLQFYELPPTSMDYCIDRFEFPNIPGENPGTMFSWEDATAICKLQDKYLCSENEWTFACEGEQALPYPYGYSRYLGPGERFPDRVPQNHDLCNIDVVQNIGNIDFNKMIRQRNTAEAMKEIDKLWAGVPSGSRAHCVSPFGVFDLTGNIEEWSTHSEGRPQNSRGPWPSIIRGGFWGPKHDRCQAAELAHGTQHFYYQTGFRCCAKSEVLPPLPPPETSQAD